jgi:hypothetical protein
VVTDGVKVMGAWERGKGQGRSNQERDEQKRRAGRTLRAQAGKGPHFIYDTGTVVDFR